MTAPAMCRWELPQFNEFESERLDVRDEPVQRGTVRPARHEHGIRGGVLRLERLQGDLQRRSQPASDAEGVVEMHVDPPSGELSPQAMVGASG